MPGFYFPAKQAVSNRGVDVSTKDYVCETCGLIVEYCGDLTLGECEECWEAAPPKIDDQDEMDIAESIGWKDRRVRFHGPRN